MSCNYYLVTNPCPTCGRSEERHVGKFSLGWRFLFQADTEVRSFAAWKQEITAPEVALRDDHGSPVTIDEFVALVDSAQGGKRHPPGMNVFQDAEGYDFTEYEFS